MTKRVDYVVAIILTNKPGGALLVKRPTDDPDLRGEWGLPATTLKPGELPEAAALRVCREKLGCEAKPERFLGVMFQKRNSYDMFLVDIEMSVVGNVQPDVKQANTKTTAYIEQKWSDNPLDLMPSAKHGSCCSSIFLTDRGLLNRSKWIASLEGSSLVG